MPANYVLLGRQELNQSAASVTFSNIPQSGYTDLKIVISNRSSSSNHYDIMQVRFNGDSSTSYTMRRLYGTGSGTPTSESNSLNRINAGYTSDAADTANTFGNMEIYIPNYLNSNYKSLSSDFVTENNATFAIAGINAGLWSNTSAINTITFLSEYGSFVQYSTFSLYGISAVGTTPAIAPKASGGNITNDGTYWIHTFYNTAAFTPQTALTCNYLVVAGGASGSGGVGAGGGAGGLRSTVTATGGGGSLETPLTLAAGSYTVTVGGGGTFSSRGAIGGAGSNSVFSTITSTGGGGGGSSVSGTSAGTGGSGGGSYGSNASGNGTNNQGRNGGTGVDGFVAFTACGGGGGAGAVGGNGTGTNGGNSTGGAGGNGVAVSITGSSVTYAGGGGGAGDTNQGAGGSGGGGAAGYNSGTNGTANCGGGGGGAANGGLFIAGNGGSGIVIIRYPIA